MGQKMKIQTITPVHIGSGGRLWATEFYIASQGKRKTCCDACQYKPNFMMLFDELKDQFILELKTPSLNYNPSL